MSDYSFSLPLPPTVNHYRACVKNRLITSKKGREYLVKVKEVMDKYRLSNEEINVPVLISLLVHPSTNHKFDVSNYLKAYEDALVKCGFLEDDSLIEYLSIKKAEKVKGGKLQVRVDIK